MNKYEETALALFEEKYNCSQSVLFAFANDFGLDPELALKISTAFGGGMGRKQEVCGAITGALMALGLKYGRSEGEPKEKMDFTYQKTREFIDEFSEIHGSPYCRDLLGCDLLTEEGQTAFLEKNLRKACEEYVTTACKLLEKYL